MSLDIDKRRQRTSIFLNAALSPSTAGLRGGVGVWLGGQHGTEAASRSHLRKSAKPGARGRLRMPRATNCEDEKSLLLNIPGKSQFAL